MNMPLRPKVNVPLVPWERCRPPLKLPVIEEPKVEEPAAMCGRWAKEAEEAAAFLRQGLNVKETAHDIIRRVADEHGVAPHLLLTQSRSRPIVRARQHIMYELFLTGRFSYPQIARLLNKACHSTVIYGIRKWQQVSSASARSDPHGPE